MENVIDFALERAKRKSGIKDTALLKDIINEGYDPCNDTDMKNYFDWQKFQKIIYNEEDLIDNWSDEAIARLWNDIQTFDESQTVPVMYEELSDKEIDIIIKPE